MRVVSLLQLLACTCPADGTLSFPTLISLATDATAIERLAAKELARLLPLVSPINATSARTVTPALAAGKVQFAVGHGAALAVGVAPARLAVLDIQMADVRIFTRG